MRCIIEIRKILLQILLGLITDIYGQPVWGLCMHRLTQNEPRDRCMAIPAILHLQSSATHWLT